MSHQKILVLFEILMLLTCCFGLMVFTQQKKEKPKYLDPNLSIDKRVKDLLSKMSLKEKIVQLQCMLDDVEKKEIIKKDGIGNLGCLLRSYEAEDAAEKANRIQNMSKEKSRLGIPIIIHDECLHGLIGKNATSFPQAIGLAATWNTELMEKVAATIGKETRSRGIHQALSPVINIARDVRWGRVEETYGEDPFLTARMGVAFCKSMEKEGVITTPKHYAANVGDGGRDSYPIHFSERLLREVYFPAFKACFQEGGATSVMAAYNSLDGLPCSANKWLLTEILRKEWGFKGFVVSDYGSVWGIVYKHHTADTNVEGAKQAIESGLDVELPNIDFYGEPLLKATKQGLVPEKTIDLSVSRVLKAKFQLGLFENTYTDPKHAARINNCKEHRELALQAGREAIVLLKNENNTLPLKKSLKSIAIIGPNADATKLGGYSGFGMKVVTVLEGIKNKIPNAQIFYAKGCELGNTALPPIPEEYLITTTDKGEMNGLKGEYFNNENLSGEPVLIRIDKNINFDWGTDPPDKKINPDKFSIRWTGKLITKVTGNYKIGVTTDDGVRLYIDGKLLIDSWFDRGTTTDISTMQLEAERKYDIKIEYYENGGYAYASLGWDVKTDIENKDFMEAIEAAKKSDVAIFVAGILEGEGRDRSNLDLPGQQENLIKAISKTGTPTIVVLINGSAITMKNWIDDVASIVEAWYPGEEGGNAIADILFGDYNPAGRLPITFPQNVGQVPLYYNHKPTGRGDDYVDLSGKPLFPFGYGLSYTNFEYNNLKINPLKARKTENVKVEVEIRNSGSIKGDEVVQIYIHDVVGSIIRPVKELRGFKRITLEPNEKKTITFIITPDELAMFDKNMKWTVEQGIFEIMMGSSSEDIRVKGNLEILR